MIAFRDDLVAKLGLELLTHTNHDGLADGVGPFTHGSAVHTDIMKTQALKQALDKYEFDAAFGGARRDEEKVVQRNAFSLSGQLNISGIRKTSARSYGPFIMFKNMRVSPFEYFHYPTGLN